MNLDDAGIVALAAVGFIGIIWSTVKLEQYRREVRIRKLIKADPYLNGIKLPKYLLRLFEATFKR